MTFYRHRPHPQFYSSCEVCDKPVKPGFYVRFCMRFHNQEYLCPDCCEIINKEMGKKFLTYLAENHGCLMEEFGFMESRLEKAFLKAKN